MESKEDSNSHSGSDLQKQGPIPSTTEGSGTTQPRFDVITARYRAAWPELLSKHDVSKAPLPSFITPHTKAIEQQAREILAHYQIKFEDEEEDAVEVQVVNQGHYTHFIPTLSITAPWSLDKQEDWKNAVRDMAGVIYEIAKAAEFDHTKVHVDMKDPRLTKTIYYGPVEKSFCDTAEWDTIRELVGQRLESFKATQGEVSVIMLLRYGELKRVEANPITIFIGCFRDSGETGWLEVIDDIQKNIAEHGWRDVYIHIEHSWAESLMGGFD